MYRFFLLVLVCFCSLSVGFSQGIEAVLKQAGSNRKELEKVLTHYSSTPADSLKFRAAEFLILNMPGKYSVYYDAPWNDVATVLLRWTSSPDKQRVLDAYGLGRQVVRHDLQHITADYLINNIELAFKVWRERPWGKHIPFDVFCEEILPYRLDTEPLENWRAKALASFAGLEAELNKPGTTAVDACAMVNTILPRIRIDKDFPSMSFSQIMASTRGTCDNMSALAVFSMRALGIPVTFDFTPRWLERPNGHSWNSVRDDSGKYIDFMGAELNPREHRLKGSPSKVYRKVYALQPGSRTADGSVPPLLEKNADVVDITAQYVDVCDIAIPLRYPPLTASSYVYLAFNGESQWLPVSQAISNRQVAHFTAVRKGMLYLPVYYENGFQTQAGDAFWLDKDGNKTVFPSEFQSTQDTLLTLHEIRPSENRYLRFLRRGVFEGANQSDFSDAQVLHTIPDVPAPVYNEIILSTPVNYRYLRYRSPSGSRCYMAEVVFYDEQNKQLTGQRIGSPGGWMMSDRTYDKAFDGDVMTYYESVGGISWTGLDLHEQKKVSKIHYLPSTEGNNIYEGHAYELFYWTKDGWQSLGVQTATTGTLQYRAPKQALFYLVNKTLDKNGSAFFIAPDNTIQWQ